METALAGIPCDSPLWEALILLALRGVFCKPTPFFEVREVCKITLKTKNQTT